MKHKDLEHLILRSRGMGNTSLIVLGAVEFLARNKDKRVVIVTSTTEHGKHIKFLANEALKTTGLYRFSKKRRMGILNRIVAGNPESLRDRITGLRAPVVFDNSALLSLVGDEE